MLRVVCMKGTRRKHEGNIPWILHRKREHDIINKEVLECTPFKALDYPEGLSTIVYSLAQSVWVTLCHLGYFKLYHLAFI